VKVFELFSKRQRDEKQAGKIEVFQYAEIPDTLRRQIRKIAQDGLGKPVHYGYSTEQNGIYKTMCSSSMRRSAETE
jgi:hypothetical protein